ncbi:hypothetical protein pEaSNUABM56_00265 [Erwinia phage pEa_SNUABM_56]|uniref:Uncharacterized protein n=1 Tax=Erwinia phage pEp_SNUABM_01 TaxID=2601643 RepID=A0A5J6DAX2_9CAUD|nr:hypothetical protein HWC63_gp139 [Erwinia phage pEp_SNUABM_01]QEQ95039.1 hypothetical protein pEpSNUABM01_213 [Erwinia phage pEp_SNUABM_01]UYL84968.1 hypothetical protein pEaSNUABM55_00195 [Erwinia phage pEa_SNUABM_55]UYL85285.1 hypothetical protein pEaSNUABM56_00265 [Erwinia phage pEa_SNUABM_56]
MPCSFNEYDRKTRKAVKPKALNVEVSINYWGHTEYQLYGKFKWLLFLDYWAENIFKPTRKPSSLMRWIHDYGFTLDMVTFHTIGRAKVDMKTMREQDLKCSRDR